MREWRSKNKEKYQAYQKSYMVTYLTPDRRVEARERAALWYKEHRDEVLAGCLPKYLNKTYGITVETFLKMLDAQNGACAICEKICVTGERLCVDHDHETGQVRGLLCRKCNSAIGMFDDEPVLVERALQYLAYYK